MVTLDWDHRSYKLSLKLPQENTELYLRFLNSFAMAQGQNAFQFWFLCAVKMHC